MTAELQGTVDREASFALFVYPFQLPLETCAETIDRLRSGPPSDAWQPLRFECDEMLPHIAQFLTAPSPHSGSGIVYWKLSETGKRELFANLEGEPDNLLVGGRAPRDIPFRLMGLRLVVFDDGVGFVTVRAEPQTDNLDDWTDALHSFRMLGGPQQSPTAGQLRCKGRDLASSDSIYRHVLSSAGIQNARDIYMPYRTLVYAVLFVDGLPADLRPHLLHRLRGLFHTGQHLIPSAHDLSTDHPSLVPQMDRQWFVLSLAGACYIAFDAPPSGADHFHRNGDAAQGRAGGQSKRLRSRYVMMLLLTLRQRFALLCLSEQVAQRWVAECDPKRRLTAFKAIHTQLLRFTATAYFTQVFQLEQQHRVYERLQEVFEIERLYREVCDEVRWMHEVVERDWQERRSDEARRVEQLLQGYGVPFAIFSLALALLTVLVEPVTQGVDALLRYGLALLILALTSWWIMDTRIRRQSGNDGGG